MRKKYNYYLNIFIFVLSLIITVFFIKQIYQIYLEAKSLQINFDATKYILNPFFIIFFICTILSLLNTIIFSKKFFYFISFYKNINQNINNLSNILQITLKKMDSGFVLLNSLQTRNKKIDILKKNVRDLSKYYLFYQLDNLLCVQYEKLVLTLNDVYHNFSEKKFDEFILEYLNFYSIIKYLNKDEIDKTRK